MRKYKKELIREYAVDANLKKVLHTSLRYFFVKIIIIKLLTSFSNFQFFQARRKT